MCLRGQRLGLEKQVPCPVVKRKLVLKANGPLVSTLRNIDGSVKGRIRFDQHPQNEYIKNYMGLGPAIAVSWEVKGLVPHAEFELHIRYPVSGSGP
jgi:hypothetical protein